MTAIHVVYAGKCIALCHVMIFPKVYYHRKLEDVKLHILYPFLLEWWREFCQPLLSHDHHGHRGDGGVTVPEIDDLSNTTGLSQSISLTLGTSWTYSNDRHSSED